MRSKLFQVVVLGSMIGCGGGGGKSDGSVDAPKPIDAAIDSPPAAACSVMADLGGLSLGTMAARQSGNWYVTPTTGVNMGKKIFVLAANLPGSTMDKADLFAIEIAKPTAGFATNTAYTYITTPMAGAATTVQSYILGDFNRTAMTIGNFYFASGGSTTFTAISETNGQAITGTSTATNFREVNQMTGADVAAGCKTMHGGVQFFLTQMAAFAPTTQPEYTPTELAFIANTIENFKAARAELEQQ